MLVVSPYAKTGYVDKTPYETVSMLKFIEKRFGVNANCPNIGSITGSPCAASGNAVPTRDATSTLGDMTNAFTGTPNFAIPTYTAPAADAGH